MSLKQRIRITTVQCNLRSWGSLLGFLFTKTVMRTNDFIVLLHKFLNAKCYKLLLLSPSFGEILTYSMVQSPS